MNMQSLNVLDHLFVCYFDRKLHFIEFMGSFIWPNAKNVEKSEIFSSVSTLYVLILRFGE